MNIYSKQDYTISKAIRNISTIGVREQGYLSPQFSTFSGMTVNNVLSKFNICILDQEVVCDDMFRKDFQTYHEQCTTIGICSLVFYHPDNTHLTQFLNEQVETASNLFIPTDNLMANYITSWLSAHYLQGEIRNLLDYYINYPILKFQELHCPLCQRSIIVPAGIFFSTLDKKARSTFAPIEKYLPCTQFTDNIGGNVYSAQIHNKTFHLYSDLTVDYANPQHCSCPDCTALIPLDIEELQQDRQDEAPLFMPIWPLRLTDKDIKTIRQQDSLTNPDTGNWVKP